jgi:hypothetical protein
MGILASITNAGTMNTPPPKPEIAPTNPAPTASAINSHKIISTGDPSASANFEQTPAPHAYGGSIREASL